MPPIRITKSRPGPQAKPIANHYLRKEDLKLILFVEWTYS